MDFQWRNMDDKGKREFIRWDEFSLVQCNKKRLRGKKTSDHLPARRVKAKERI